MKSIMVSRARLILRGVKESTYGFLPLKAVAGYLCLILDSCAVQFFPLQIQSVFLTTVPANRGERGSHRITGTPDQNAV